MTAERAEIERRLQARKAEDARLGRVEERLGVARLGVFAAAAVLAWLALVRHAVAPGWLVLPGAAFLALVVRHGDVRTARDRARRATAFWARAASRVDGTWMGTGPTGERFRDPAHPYAEDLDLFGAGSLFQLLSTARTRIGEATLAGWLLAPAPPDDVRARQAAVDELRPRLDLREALALAGEDVEDAVDPAGLATWASRPPVAVPRWARPLAAMAGAFAAAMLVPWAYGVWQPLAVAIALEGAVALALRGRVHAALHGLDRPTEDLSLLAALLALLEAERFDAPRLQALRAGLDAAGTTPSAEVRRLRRLSALLDARRNQLFAPIGWLLLWTTQLALAIEAWRATHGAAVLHWLQAVGEAEALTSLASHAYEHPHRPFAVLADGPPSFDAEGLVHPLLPSDRAVPNALRLGGDAPHVLVVSGSNMSGKSTLLRAAGLATVLAQAGAPAPAARLRLTPLAVGASLRLSDSVQAGTSRFYAELTRVKQVMDLAAAGPVLALLDELFAGTNSHDRRIGAEAVVRGLVDRSAIGCVTTHDLALALVADALGTRAANVHFEDRLEDGRLHFDYRLRPGVVTRSNALDLMRAVGLEVG